MKVFKYFRNKCFKSSNTLYQKLCFKNMYQEMNEIHIFLSSSFDYNNFNYLSIPLKHNVFLDTTIVLILQTPTTCKQEGLKTILYDDILSPSNRTRIIRLRNRISTSLYKRQKINTTV